MAPGEEPRELDRVLVRLGAPGGEDRLHQVARGDLGELAGERRLGLGRERRGHVAEDLRLLLDGPNDTGMSMAEVRVHQLGAEIEDPAIAGVEPHAVGAGDDEG